MRRSIEKVGQGFARLRKSVGIRWPRNGAELNRKDYCRCLRKRAGSNFVGRSWITARRHTIYIGG